MSWCKPMTRRMRHFFASRFSRKDLERRRLRFLSNSSCVTKHLLDWQFFFINICFVHCLREFDTIYLCFSFRFQLLGSESLRVFFFVFFLVGLDQFSSPKSIGLHFSSRDGVSKDLGCEMGNMLRWRQGHGRWTMLVPG